MIDLLLVCAHSRPFILRDAEALRRWMNVQLFEYRSKRDLIPLSWLQRDADCTLCWFSLGHATGAALLAKLVSRPLVVIVGGWDVAAESTLGHGAMLSPRRRLLTRAALRLADRVISVSEFTKRETQRWTARPVSVVYNGVDTDRFAPMGDKAIGVVSALGVSDAVRFRTKGVDLVLEAARLLPSVPFDIFGENPEEWRDRLRKMAPPNVTIHDRDGESAWLAALKRSKVYLQPSRYESFGISVAEAMACGCVPVVASVGGLPEVVGKCGFVLQDPTPPLLAQSILQAMESDLGSAARRRIELHFTLATRARRIAEIVRELVEAS